MLTDADGALANEDTGKLTKANLIEEVSKVTALHWQEAASIVECILDSIVHAIERGDKVEIRGFGSFRTRQRGGRVARNPKTGARVEVAPKANSSLQTQQGATRAGGPNRPRPLKIKQSLPYMELGCRNIAFIEPNTIRPYDDGGGRAAKGERSVKNKQQEPMPQGCRKCNGNPWIVDKGGMRRCTCPRGVYFQQRDRERAAKEVRKSL
jgi:integration host factor subunit beta